MFNESIEIYPGDIFVSVREFHPNIDSTCKFEINNYFYFLGKNQNKNYYLNFLCKSNTIVKIYYENILDDFYLKRIF